jgi:lipoprotein NlpD
MALLAVCAAWLVGCASDPVEDEDRPIGESPLPSRPPGGSYRVVKGDTLYSISFKRGLDYREVAAWNGISAPAYKILVGQEIRFSPPGARAARPVAASATPASAPAAATAANTPPAGASPKDSGIFEDAPNPPATSATTVPVTTATPAPAAAAAEPAPVTSAPTATPPSPTPPPAAVPAKSGNESAASSVGGIAWRWPNGGKVIGTYVAGNQTRQGIDIAGAAGDPVLACADGEVVYSGNGLLGYGELIIVKHSASFLSAYGHNRKRLVAEGDKVRAGQQIAEMGSSASSRDELHFEIRKDGKPVNPLNYLPPR